METDDLNRTATTATSPAIFFGRRRPVEDVGWCLSLGVVLALGASRGTPKPLATAIELTHGALRSAKALRHLPSPSSPESLLFASKAFDQGYKISKNLNLHRPKPLSTLYKRLKPCFGAINVVRYVRSPISDGGGGFLGFGLLSYGYKFSKNVLRVLEGFVGVELDAALRNGFDAVGLMVKAVKVAREVGTMVARGGAGAEEAQGSDSYSFGYDDVEVRGGICVRFVERWDLAAVGGSGGVGVWEGKGGVREGEGLRLGELFCLSVPLDERLMRCCCVVA